MTLTMFVNVNSALGSILTTLHMDYLTSCLQQICETDATIILFYWWRDWGQEKLDNKSRALRLVGQPVFSARPSDSRDHEFKH